MSKLRTAVVGVGYLGRFHAQKHRALDNVDLVAVCDRDLERGRAVAAEVQTTAVQDYRELVGKIDAVTIAATTAEHFSVARFFLEHGVHCLVEKPLTATSAEAAVLTKLAADRKLKLQVGHVERFNPALLAARETLTTVRFIECHRLAPFANSMRAFAMSMSSMSTGMPTAEAATGCESTSERITSRS